MTGARTTLSVPAHFDAGRVGEVWRVPYEARAAEARAWATEHGVQPSVDDGTRIALVLVDVQNTFCIPDFELFVGGRSGTGAVDDNRRLCWFIYRHLHRITTIFPTLDTHRAIQIFHAPFLVDREGRHPPPFTRVSARDVAEGRWRFNDAVAPGLGMTPAEGQTYLVHYTRALERGGRFTLTIWPYHAMLGGIGHAMVSAVEEAVFFHTVVRSSQPEFQIKGDNPKTESYSVFGPEVLDDVERSRVAAPATTLVDRLLGYDALVVAGQAKSHCVNWTVDDLLTEIQERDPGLADKVYLLEDCTSPVVVGSMDYSADADAAFERFAETGVQIVSSTTPLAEWPGVISRTP